MGRFIAGSADGLGRGAARIADQVNIIGRLDAVIYNAGIYRSPGTQHPGAVHAYCAG